MTEFKRDTAEVENGSDSTAEQGDARSPDMQRREFIKRFGVYTAGSAVGLYVLLSARTSQVQAAYDGGG